ncbi:conserved hypothetical protein [Theileria equi strain WA]|uniref:BCNT-C domain-containing protein n=1 Tax=Theileria equi strain WA TaxID=1537102 RepID=L1LCU9_THEEQ|nr:conserved hypothetical protein [Theileria equi strain WA]EKX73109.1 conserved hypothetical protein [Theileria equi strain WA]|eukprot:XP_004832561.1 conserved hypothetical protein [Theileria equi strain WA]
MSTILDLAANSDESDSDYVLSEPQSESEDEKKAKKKRDREKNRAILQSKVNEIYSDMLKESENIYKHPSGLSDSFMLQFHKKHVKPIKNKSLKYVENYVKNSSSIVYSEDSTLDIKTFKEQCYKTPNNEILDIVKKAVSVDETEPVTVKKTYTFAGQTYELHDKVDKKSKKYINHLKKQEKSLGGSFSFLDQMLSEIGPKQTLSAISKSEVDWNKYKDENDLDTSLKKDHRYIKEQAFLQRANWKEHENSLQARK